MLWRERRIRRLLNLIDRLPPNTHYHAAVLLDPQVAEELQQMKAAEDKRAGRETPAPSQAVWSAEVAVMTEVKDILSAFKHQEMAIALSKAGKSAGDGPKPSPRPKTAMSVAKAKRDMDKHLKLRARALPHKYGNPDPVE